MPKFNLQDRYNKLPEFTKGVLDTVPTWYVVLFISFFLDLSTGTVAALAIPFLILSWFTERLKAQYMHVKMLDFYGDGFEDGMKEGKRNE